MACMCVMQRILMIHGLFIFKSNIYTYGVTEWKGKETFVRCAVVNHRDKKVRTEEAGVR